MSKIVKVIQIIAGFSLFCHTLSKYDNLKLVTENRLLNDTLKFLPYKYKTFNMIRFSGEDFKLLRKSLIKQDRLAMNQLVDSLNDIAWEYLEMKKVK